MKLFFEEEQAERRRARVRVRRIAAFVAVPSGVYVVLVVVSLLGGPRIGAPLIPLPNPGAADAIDPVAGLATTRTTARAFPPIPAETTKPAQQTPTPTPSLRPRGQQSEPATVGSADRAQTPMPVIEPEDRPTTDRPPPRPADDRSNPPTPPATKTPPAPTDSPTPTSTPSTTSEPPGDPDNPEQPTLVDTLLTLLTRLPL